MNNFQFVQSDADEELLINIPFTGNIKLKGMIIIGPNDDSHPDRVKMYVKWSICNEHQVPPDCDTRPVELGHYFQ